jgi:hypothetical protein
MLEQFLSNIGILTNPNIGANLINKEVIYYLGFKRNLTQMNKDMTT